jgi:malate dehydrogenase (oxaloacetate-decarboxylating)
MKIPEILLIESQHRPGSLAKVLTVIGECGLVVEHLTAIRRDQDKTIWELTLELDTERESDVFARIDALPNARVLGRSDRVFDRHKGGKIQMVSRVALESRQVLRDIYTPGVARVCLEIQQSPAKACEFTNVNNTVAIVTNGTAILGLGDIGPLAGLPVMEGKSAIFAAMTDITGVPILTEERDPVALVEHIAAIAPSFGAIQLEDIAGPACFAVEQGLRDVLNIPVLHDDQHGTAVVTLGALLSISNLVGFDLRDKVVGQIGLGAAGLGIARLLRRFGVRKVLGADLAEDALLHLETLGGQRSTLPAIMAECDIVMATTGVKGLIEPNMVREGQVILALSNPEPEIDPIEARAAGAAFAADGQSINNILGFPGLFRGALDAGAKRFTDEMLFAAAQTLADLSPVNEMMPDALDRDLHREVAEKVADAAYDSGACA